MGATGRRLVAQLLTESVLLGMAASLAGLAVAELLLSAYRVVSTNRPTDFTPAEGYLALVAKKVKTTGLH